MQFFFKFIKNSYKGSHTHITLFFHFLAYCVLHSNLAQRIISYSKLYFFIIHEKRSKVMNMGVCTYKRTCDDHIYFCFCFLREMCRIFWWCPYIILGICRNKLYMGLHMSKLLTICILLGLCVIRVTTTPNRYRFQTSIWVVFYLKKFYLVICISKISYDTNKHYWKSEPNYLLLRSYIMCIISIWKWCILK